MQALGVPFREIDIRPICLDEMKALGHAPFGIPLDGLDVEGLTRRSAGRARRAPQRPDVRERPGAGADEPADEHGLRGRHRRPVRAGPRLVHLQRRPHEHVQPERRACPRRWSSSWSAGRPRTSSTATPAATLLDIVGDARSRRSCCRPAPTGRSQSTEGTIGPYELHDFFLYHFLRFGATPEKILYLASQAKFDRDVHGRRGEGLAAACS